MLTAIKINKMRRLPATFKQLTTKQLKSNSIINLYYYYLKPKDQFFNSLIISNVSISFTFCTIANVDEFDDKIPFFLFCF